MKKRKLLLSIVGLNLILLFGLLSTISTPAKAVDQSQWQYYKWVCYDPPYGFTYKCDPIGFMWVCWDGWPDIPCGYPNP